MAEIEPERASNPRRAGGVQSIERAFLLLETLADAEGMLGLSQLAAASGLPLPTIHRLIRTLVDLGYVRQESSRRYMLAPRLIRLGEASTKTLGFWAGPHLAKLVDELGETANLAMLDGDQIVYVAQMPGRHYMRMFTEVGRRVQPHCTAVGKAILASLPPEEARQIIKRIGMPRLTEHTITDPAEFMRRLEWIAQHGYALDEGEQEIGVRCVAVAVPQHPMRLALSVSGPATRMTEALIERAVPMLTMAASKIAAEAT